MFWNRKERIQGGILDSWYLKEKNRIGNRIRQRLPSNFHLFDVIAACKLDPYEKENRLRLYREGFFLLKYDVFYRIVESHGVNSFVWGQNISGVNLNNANKITPQTRPRLNQKSQRQKDHFDQSHDLSFNNAYAAWITGSGFDVFFKYFHNGISFMGRGMCAR